MLVLGIESSCDETSAAVVRDGCRVLSNVVASQEMLHADFGGVVPELAGRKHLEAIGPVVDEALARAGVTRSQVEGVAVTRGPGLVGSLLVGLNYAKALARVLEVPLVGVNHLEGHLAGAFLEHPECRPPLVALVVSGGHTSLFLAHGLGRLRLLGATLDDAAGEAFDKVAKLLGLGYPGGRVIDELAETGDPGLVHFPRAMLDRGGFDFSFSGLKTAVLTHVRKQGEEYVRGNLPHLAAAFREAVVEVLVAKTMAAAERCAVDHVVVAGGVAVNRRLRVLMNEEGSRRGLQVFFPPVSLCTDNAAMIAAAGDFYLSRGFRDGPDLNALARWEVPDRL